MSSIKDFLLTDVSEMKDEIRPSDRFKSPFVIRAITETKNEQLRKQNERVTINKRLGRKEKTIDQDGYMADLILECIVEPDLKNKEMQTHYGTIGDAAGTLKAMVTSGEYATLLEAVQELNGYDNDIDELRDEAKKD